MAIICFLIFVLLLLLTIVYYAQTGSLASCPP